jgi:uncharacterized protein (TIRG00374 family)
MRRRLPVLLFLLGFAGFSYLIWRIGPARLLADARATGWLFAPLILLYALVFLCHAITWRFLLADAPKKPPFGRLYAITVSGFSLNTVTPVVQAGGHAFRIASLAPWVGKRRSASATISFVMMHALGSVSTWITALVGAIVLLHDRPYVLPVGIPLLAGLLLFAWTIVGGHRHGVLERALAVVRRLPLPARVARTLEARREATVAVDRHITGFYHDDPRRFVLAFAFDYLARCIGFVEYWIACLSVGAHIGYERAFMIGALAAMGGNLLFFIPFEIGWKEGVMYGLFGALGLDPATGVYVSVLTRVREVVWIGIGILLTWAAPLGKPEFAAPEPDGTGPAAPPSAAAAHS